MRRPSRRDLSTLAFAVCALAVLVAPASAHAQQQDGWRGSISVVYAFSGSAPGESVSHREEAQYVFDGSLQPGTEPGPFLWDQPTAWTASFHEARSVSEGCPEGAPFNSTANGSGTGTGRGRVQFQQFGTDPDWQYEIHATSTSAPFQVTVSVSCGGGEMFNQNPFGASNAFDGVWVRLPAGQTPQETTTLLGQREFENITFQGDHITVSWSLTREPDPPECSNGIDDDLDGFTDFAGGVPGLRDPGCQSNADDSEAHGSIIIDKQTSPPGSPQSFEFDGPLGGFTLTDESDPVRIDLEPGSYQVSETELADWRSAGITCDDSDSTGDPATRTATVQLAAGETVRCTFTNSEIVPLTVDVTVGYEYLGFAKGTAAANGFDFARALGSPEALAKVGQICIRSFWSATAKLAVPTTTPMFWNGEVGPFTNPDWALISRTAPSKGGIKGDVSETIRITSCGATQLVRLPLGLTVTSPGLIKALSHWTVAELYSPTGTLLGSVTAETGTFSKKDTTETDATTQTLRVD